MSGGMAIVTGATSGIGEATARLLKQKNYDLLLTGRREDRLKALKQELGPSTKIACFDVSDREACEKFFKDFEQDLAKATVLVNNAGLARGRDPIQTSSFGDMDAMVDTNIKGLLYMTRGVLPFFIRQNRGHVVNIGSVAGRFTYPGGSVYAGTKFAVRAISEGLRFDLLGTPVRVTNIEPGMVETEFSVVRFQDEQQARSVYRGMTPLTAGDIAETIVWSLERPPHVNIQEIVVYPVDQASPQNVSRKGL